MATEAAAATDAAAVATDAAAVDAAAATRLVATVAVASTVAAVAEALEDVAGAASGGGAAAAVYPGARASSARPHGLVALICKVFLEGPPVSGSAPAAEDLTSKHELCVFG